MKKNFNTSPTITFNPQKDKIFLVFRYEDILIYDRFLDKIKDKLEIDKDYIMFIKLRYNTNNFRFCGKQIGFKFNLSNLSFLWNTVLERIVITTDRYEVESDSIDVIMLTCIKLDKSIKSDIEIDKSLSLSRKGLRNAYINNISKFKEVPLVINEDIGDLLQTSINEYDIIEKIDFVLNNENINFLDKIQNSYKLLHPNKIIEFDKSFKFYYICEDNNKYILAVKSNNDIIEKTKYSLDGVVIKYIEDKLIENNTYSRKIDNSETIISNNVVIYFKQNLKLYPIIKPKTNTLFVPNPNIGVIDTETYKDMDGINKIFCLGFKTNLSEECTTFYIDPKTLDSDKIVISLIDEILRPKYDTIKTFFCHNLGGFDIVFILSILVKYNDKYGEKYNFKFLFRDESIINLTISIKDESGKKRSVSLGDSYCLLNDKLSNLAKTFEVNTMKGIFPYEFSRRENLFYKGDVPNIKYYNYLDITEYEKIRNKYRNHWDFKAQAISYLKDDLCSLFEVLTKANKQVFNDFNVNLIDSNTISSLATKIYLKDYYEGNIPSINKNSLYKDIKEAYYGGITEVYKPRGKDLFYYDVNSLYPFVARNNDMPGTEAYFESFSTAVNIEKLFGFYYCEVECTKDLYLGLLPKRTSSGLHFPLGKWKGWYFSEEIKFALKHGYTIRVIKGYNFNRVKNTFTKYIDYIYKIKQNPINKTQKTMAKSLLNNLLGRFGIQLERDVTCLVNWKEFNRISIMYNIISYKNITKDDILVTYTPILDHELIDNHNLDIVKVMEKFKEKEITSVQNTSIAISAAITAYARIHITNLKLQILDQKGDIFYSDTDSIVTNKELSSELVNNELGGLKLEHIIKEGIFISGKTYCFINDKNVFVNRAKGVKSNSLNFDDYASLLKGNNIDTALKTSSRKNWETGDVDISTNKITLYHDSYKKREKIFKLNRWVNTKPWVIKEDDVNLDLSKVNTLIDKPRTGLNMKDVIKNIILIKNNSILDRIKLDKEKIKKFCMLVLLTMFWLAYVIHYIEKDNLLEEKQDILETEIFSNHSNEIVDISYDNDSYETKYELSRLLDYNSNNDVDIDHITDIELIDDTSSIDKEEIKFFNELQDKLEKEYYMNKISDSIINLYKSVIDEQSSNNNTNTEDSLLSNLSYVTAQEQIEIDELDNTFNEIQKSNMIWILRPLDEDQPEFFKNESDVIPSKSDLVSLSKNTIILTSKICDIDSVKDNTILIPDNQTDAKNQTFVSHIISYNNNKFECRMFVNEDYLKDNSQNTDSSSDVVTVIYKPNKSVSTDWMEKEDYNIDMLYKDHRIDETKVKK